MNKKFFDEFIKYANKLFPYIDMETKETLKNALNQFDTTKFNWFTIERLEGITQGDILNKIPFIWQDDDGSNKVYPTKAMVLSNSCDIENDKYILMAPLIYYGNTNEFNKEQEQTLLNNMYNGKMCFPGTKITDYYVDFSKIQSFNREIIFKLINSNKIKVEYSLSQIAWYFLITKLTIHFMRAEDHKLFEERLVGV